MALVTVQDVMNWCNVSLTSAQQSAVTGLIDDIEDYLKAFILDWTSESAAMHGYSGNGCSVLYLSRWLSDIDSITVGDQSIDLDDVSNKGYKLVRKSGAIWTEGVDNVEITGDWGWTTAPADFVLAARLVIKQCLESYFQPETQSETVGGQAFAYIAKAFGENRLVGSILRKYTGPKIR